MGGPGSGPRRRLHTVVPRLPDAPQAPGLPTCVATEFPRGPFGTIVADPPWPYEYVPISRGRLPDGNFSYVSQPLPYPTMTLFDIAKLPVGQLLSEDGTRLFLWTTNRFLPAAFEILGAWGFEYRQTLVWHKSHHPYYGSVAANSAEFILVGVAGAPRRLQLDQSAVIKDGSNAHKPHSTKPEVFMEMFERVSPGPYVELFARQARPGWVSWGNEVNDG